MEERVTYVFTLITANQCDAENIIVAIGISKVSFATNRRPINGLIPGKPSEGRAIFDICNITTTNWIDPEGDLPLTFSFETISIPNDSQVTKFFRTSKRLLDV